MPHQTGQGEPIHTGLCGPGAERVTPALEQARQFRVFNCCLVRVLDRSDVSRNASARKHKGGWLPLGFCGLLAPLWDFRNARGERKASLRAIRLALANVKHSVRGFGAHRQIHIGPFQREQFTYWDASQYRLQQWSHRGDSPKPSPDTSPLLRISAHGPAPGIAAIRESLAYGPVCPTPPQDEESAATCVDRRSR